MLKPEMKERFSSSISISGGYCEHHETHCFHSPNVTVRAFPSFLRSFKSLSRKAMEDEGGKKFFVELDVGDSLVVVKRSSLHSGDCATCKSTNLASFSLWLASNVVCWKASSFFGLRLCCVLRGRLEMSPRILQSSPSSPSSLNTRIILEKSILIF